MSLSNLVYFDNLTLIMTTLICFVAICVASFASRYLNGDSRKTAFFCYLTALTASALIMVSSNHIFILFSSWLGSNIFLSRLMLHNSKWQAAKQSYIVALKHLILGSAFLGTALTSLYITTGHTLIQNISQATITQTSFSISIVFITLAAMVQSALWPFHTWLISSLNSPTPASAIMHAGLINGGGFLIARFAFLFINNEYALNILFTVGIATALLGTLWKLMQTDVKRMLACSTMGQMGFMIAQCGLGLFPSAVAHICWHGLFKANLFLSSNSAAHETRFPSPQITSLSQCVIAMLCGIIGAWAFASIMGRPLITSNTTLFLNYIAFITATQLALSILHTTSLSHIILAMLSTLAAGCIYGVSVQLIENLLPTLSNAQPINLLHVLALFLLTSAWLGMFIKIKTYPNWLLSLFVKTLNASQPHPQTITTHRNHYKF